MNDERFSDKVALVTGAGSGIGEATARMLVREAATVYAADIDFDAAQRVATQCSERGKILPLLLDVSAERSWEEAVEAILSQHGRINVVVNNAGVSFAMPTDDMSLERWRSLMAVNLDGVFLGTRHAIQAMKPQGGGSIVNVASVSGITPSPTAAAYCASKAAVRMFTQAVAIECADGQTGIRINVVTPGGVITPMWEKQEFFQQLVAEHGSVDRAFAAMAGNSPSQRFHSADDVARTILYLASGDSSHLTGTEIVMDRSCN